MPYSGDGSGTSEDPYIITDVYQLVEVNDDLTAYYRLGNDIDATPTDKNHANWNETEFPDDGEADEGWVGIGDDDNEFSGDFDGAGHTVDGLTGDQGNYYGLFARADGGDIYDVGVTNLNIVGGLYTAGIVGWAEGSSTVSRCFAKGSLHSRNNTIAGICGRAESVTISDCYSEVTVTADDTSSSRIGGIVGRSGGAGDCYNSGSVQSNGAAIRGDSTSGSTDCFYDSETSTTTNPGGGTAKTTAQMKTFTTFSSVWDIEEIGDADGSGDVVWFIDDGNDYPRLWFEFVGGGGGDTTKRYSLPLMGVG